MTAVKGGLSSDPTELRAAARMNGDRRTLVISTPTRFDFGCHQDFRRTYDGESNVAEYVVDFAGTDYIDSSALGMLLLLRERAGRAPVRLVNTKPTVKKILQVANFQALFRLE